MTDVHGLRREAVDAAAEVLEEAGVELRRESGWSGPREGGTLAVYEVLVSCSLEQAAALGRAWDRKMRERGRFGDALDHALVSFTGLATPEEDAHLEAMVDVETLAALANETEALVAETRAGAP